MAIAPVSVQLRALVLTDAEKQARWRERHIRRGQRAQRIVNILMRRQLLDEHVAASRRPAALRHRPRRIRCARLAQEGAIGSRALASSQCGATPEIKILRLPRGCRRKPSQV